MFDDFKDIPIIETSKKYIGQLEYDALLNRLKNHIIDDDLKAISNLFSRYDCDTVLFFHKKTEQEELNKFLVLFNLASIEVQKHLLYHIVNTKKFKEKTKTVFELVTNLVYMKDNPVLFKDYINLMKDKEYLFNTYGEEVNFAFPTTILENIFRNSSQDILNFVCQSKQFTQALGGTKNWKFIKNIMNAILDLLPEDRLKTLEVKIKNINPMLNTLFEANPLVKEKIGQVVINSINHFLNDNNSYYLAKNYEKVTHQFFDNLYINGVIDYNQEMPSYDNNEVMLHKIKDYIEESDFKEITNAKTLFQISEKKMIELEKLKLEKMMFKNHYEKEKKIKI